MAQFKVSDIEIGKKDSAGAEVLTVYGKVSGKLNGLDCGRYAVYRTARQVMIQFSDDDAEGISQRAALTTIVPLRSAITTMISKLEDDESAYQRAKADEYANRLGISLLIALQGNQDLAATVMATIRDDMVEDKASDTRTQHLIWASVATLVSVIVASLFGSPWFLDAFSGMSISAVVWPNCWHAAAIGSIGALFSIALQIRARQVPIDSQPWDNISDAVLRILVGATSGAILAALFLGKIVDIKIGGNSLLDIDGYGIMIIAFAGGFAERLVAEFLATIGLTGSASRAAAKPVPPPVADERNLAGKPAGANGAANAGAAVPPQGQMPAVPTPPSSASAEEAVEPDDDQEEADDVAVEADPSKLPPVG